jgi:hypothetical protein
MPHKDIVKALTMYKNVAAIPCTHLARTLQQSMNSHLSLLRISRWKFADASRAEYDNSLMILGAVA